MQRRGEHETSSTSVATVIVLVVSSGVVTDELSARRARSFTGVTLMLTVAVLEVTPPSEAVYVNESGPK